VVDAMRSAGVTRFVEVGPGRVLSGLIRRIAPDAETIPLDDPGAPGGLADPDPAADG
jgi:[acyl-carrier-protein] S-malonyltransferase